MFLIEGRNERTCKRHESAQAIGNKGFNVQETICKSGDDLCPHYSSCPYQAQREEMKELKKTPLEPNDPARIFLMAHGYLTTNSALPVPDLVIIDETHWQRFLMITDNLQSPKFKDFTIAELKGFANNTISHCGTYLEVINALAEATIKNHLIIPLLMCGLVEDVWKNALDHLSGVISAQEKINTRPNYPEDEIMGAVSASKVPRLRLAVRLLEALWHEVKIGKVKSTSLTYDPDTSFLRLKTIKNNMIPHEVPVLLIDASADFEINSLIWGQRLQSFEIRVERNAQIIQVSNRTFSKFSLGVAPSWAKDWIANDKQLEFRDELIDFISEIAEQTKEEILVVASKGIIKAIPKSLPPNAVTAHFSALRGLNKFEHIKTVIMIGREEPNHKIIEDMAQALASFSANKDLLASQKYTKSSRFVRMSDGSFQKASVRTHVDGLAQRVLEQIREREIEQGLDRLRLLNTVEMKTAYLLTSVVIDATIDEFSKCEKIARISKMDKAFQFALSKAKAFPLGDRDIFAAAPSGLWSSHDGVGGYIRRRDGVKWVGSLIRYYMGNDPLLGVTYRTPEQRGEASLAIVSANEPDPQTALEKVLGGTVTDFKIEHVKEPSGMADIKKISSIPQADEQEIEDEPDDD